VEGFVQCPVPTPIEPVAGGLAAGGLDRAGPGELGEGGVAAAASGVGERDDGLGGADGADSGLAEQPGSQVVDNRGQLGAVGGKRAGGLASCEGEAADLAVAYGLLAARVEAGGGEPSWPRRCRSTALGPAGGRCPRRRVAGRAAGWSAPVVVVVSSARAQNRIRKASRSPSARAVGSLSASRHQWGSRSRPLVLT
jgi:hypothetical protein